MVIKTVLFTPQIKTTQRYVWTKREFTEEGKLLGELVDQVSLFFFLHITRSICLIVPLKACSSFLFAFFLALGYHSCEDQQ